MSLGMDCYCKRPHPRSVSASSAVGRLRGHWDALDDLSWGKGCENLIVIVIGILTAVIINYYSLVLLCLFLLLVLLV